MDSFKQLESQMIQRVPPRHILNNYNNWYRNLKKNHFVNSSILKKQKIHSNQPQLYCAQITFDAAQTFDKPEDTFAHQKAKSRFALKCYATLFSAMDMQFYGRTPESHIIPLIQDSQNAKLLRVQEKDLSYNDFQMFMLTRRPDLDSFVVIDVSMIEYPEKFQNVYHHVGFVVLPLFLKDSNFLRRIFYKGSPRQLMSLNPQCLFDLKIPGLVPTQYDIEFRFRQIVDEAEKRKFKNIGVVMSESSLFNSEDTLPGVIGNKIPMKVLSIPYQTRLGRKKTLFIYRLKLVLEGINEQEILERMKQRAIVQFQLQNYEKVEISISERNVHIQVHNTWKAIGKSQVFNLQEPQETIAQNDLTVLEAGANIQISEFIVDQFVATIFQIQYQMKIVVDDTHIHMDTINFANFVFLPTLNKDTAQDDIMDELYTHTLHLNNQQPSLFGELLYFHDVSYPVLATLQAIISTKISVATQLDMQNLQLQVEQKNRKQRELQEQFPMASNEFRSEMFHQQEVKRQLQGDLNYQKREQQRQIEDIEKLKFKQDVKTGLTYFDKVKEIVKEGEKVVDGLKQQYENNVSKLLFITKQDDFKDAVKSLDQPDKIVYEKLKKSKEGKSPSKDKKKHKKQKSQDEISQNSSSNNFFGEKQRMSENFVTTTQIYSQLNEDDYQETQKQQGTEMTRQDTLAFIRLGHTQLYQHNYIEKDQIKLMNELQDSQRKSNYIITILGFEGLQNPGSKLLIRVKFFTKQQQQHLGKMIIQRNMANIYQKNQKSLFWIRQYDSINKQLDVMSFTFDIDCIHERDMSDFFKYIFQGDLNIELYDYHTLFLIGQGSCNILTSLRQGKEYQVVGYKITLRNYENKELGDLFFMIENKGIFVLQDLIDKANINDKHHEEKKKIYSKANDSEIFKIQQFDSFYNDNEFDKENLDDNERKKLRVSRFKQKTNTVNKSVMYMEPSLIEQEQQLNNFVSIREQVKDTMIQQKLNQAILKRKSLDVRQGEPTFYVLEIKNPLRTDEIFNVQVRDQLIEQLDIEPEIQLVKNLEELQYWTELGFYHQSDLDLLLDNYDDIFLPNNRGILLKASKHIRLLFKIKTLREACSMPQLPQNEKMEQNLEDSLVRDVEDSLIHKDKASQIESNSIDTKYQFGQRNIEIEVIHSNKSILSITTLEICPRYQSYETMNIKDNFIKADKSTSIQLIQNFTKWMIFNEKQFIKPEDLKNIDKVAQNYIFKSSIKADINLDKKENLILKINPKKRVGEHLDVFIFIYKNSNKNEPLPQELQDYHQNDLIKVLKVTLLTAVYLKPKIKIGKESIIDLDIYKKTGILRLLKLSDHDQMSNNINLFVDPQEEKYYLSLISLGNAKNSKPNNKNEDLKIKTKFYLNLIDRDTKAIKYPIIIQPKFKKPKIDRYIEVKIQPNQDCFNLTVQNPFSHSKICQILVQDIEIIKPQYTQSIQDKNGLINYTFRIQASQLRAYIETIFTIAPLFLGHGETQTFLMKIIPSYD
eukprot:403335185